MWVRCHVKRTHTFSIDSMLMLNNKKRLKGLNVRQYLPSIQQFIICILCIVKLRSWAQKKIYVFDPYAVVSTLFLCRVFVHWLCICICKRNFQTYTIVFISITKLQFPNTDIPHYYAMFIKPSIQHIRRSSLHIFHSQTFK